MGYNTTILKQILQPISRYEFEKQVKFYEAEKHAKGLSCWNQFTAMVFAQITKQTSLKSIESGLRANNHCLYHLGISKTSKSTLAYANTKRDYRVYKHLFYYVLSKVKEIAPKHRFKFTNKLSSIDGTTIDLCKTTFPWADFRKNKSGLKLVIKLDHNGYIPEDIDIKNARKHERHSMNQFCFEENEIVAFDKGFSDYNFFASLYKNGTYFVTRLKRNARYEVNKELKIIHKNILSDKLINFSGFTSKKKCPMKLRLIKSYDPETENVIDIITNNFTLSAKTIAAIYKERWQIEILFKMLKQYFKIKKYFGNSRNAVLTQIYIALICYLLIAYMKFLYKIKIPLSQILSLFSLMAFSKIEISALFGIIEKPPPNFYIKNPVQGRLFDYFGQ